MRRWLGEFDLSMTLIAFGFLILKGSFSIVGWSEAVGVALVLIVHYARSLVPEKKKTSLDVAQIEKALQEIESLKEDVARVKLAAGFRPGAKVER